MEPRKKLLGPCDDKLSVTIRPSSMWLAHYEEFICGTKFMTMPKLEQKAISCPVRSESKESVEVAMTKFIRAGQLDGCGPMETLKCLLLQKHWNSGD